MMLEDWASSGDGIRASKMDYLLRVLVPWIIKCVTDMWKRMAEVPQVAAFCDVGYTWMTRPVVSRNVAQIQKIVESSIDALPPKHVEKTVCRLCRKLKAAGAKWCKFCPGKIVEEIVEEIVESEEGCAASGLGHGGCAHLRHHAATQGVDVRP